MKIDLNGSVRARTDDERTEAGVDESHTFFIVCPATSVSANHSCLVLFATPSLTVAFFLPGLCAQRRTHGRPHRQVVQVPNQCLLGDFPGGRRLLLECCACTSTRGGEGVQRARGAWRGHARRPRALRAPRRPQRLLDRPLLAQGAPLLDAWQQRGGRGRISNLPLRGACRGVDARARYAAARAGALSTRASSRLPGTRRCALPDSPRSP